MTTVDAVRTGTSSDMAVSTSDGPSSHPVSNSDLKSVTPESLTPKPTSPNSDSGYSPHSQPFVERPLCRTSAGAAVRQSASDLPSPPPFTPGLALPAANGHFRGSDFARSSDIDTPGVTSAWAGSSSKGPSEGFAFAPHEAPGILADLPFPTTTTVPPIASELLARTAINMSASVDIDGMSECSETASRSSVNSRGSGARWSRDGPSTAEKLYEVRNKLVQKAAIEGTGRLGRSMKSSAKTPSDKGVRQLPVPHNTPIDASNGHREDQQLPVLQAAAGALEAGPLTALSKSKSLSSSPIADKIVPLQAASPPDSRTSVVSIGSICGPANMLLTAEDGLNATRKLDFAGVVTDVQVHMLAAGVPSLGTDWSPMPPEKLVRSMQDPYTRKVLGQGLLGVEEFAAKFSTDAATMQEAFAMAQPAATSKRHFSWVSKALLTLVLGGVLLAVALISTQLLPLHATSGIVCSQHNSAACTAAHKAYWNSLDKEPAGLQLAVMRAAWFVQDAWDMLRGRQVQGISPDDLARAWISKINEQAQRDMPLDLARQLFGDMSPHLVPPIIAAKLHEGDSSSSAAAMDQLMQQPPLEDLIAVTNAAPAIVHGSLLDTAAAEDSQLATTLLQQRSAEQPAGAKGGVLHDAGPTPYDGKAQAGSSTTDVPDAAAVTAPEVPEQLPADQQPSGQVKKVAAGGRGVHTPAEGLGEVGDQQADDTMQPDVHASQLAVVEQEVQHAADSDYAERAAEPEPQPPAAAEAPEQQQQQPLDGSTANEPAKATDAERAGSEQQAAAQAPLSGADAAAIDDATQQQLLEQASIDDPFAANIVAVTDAMQQQLLEPVSRYDSIVADTDATQQHLLEQVSRDGLFGKALSDSIEVSPREATLPDQDVSTAAQAVGQLVERLEPTAGPAAKVVMAVDWAIATVIAVLGGVGVAALLWGTQLVKRSAFKEQQFLPGSDAAPGANQGDGILTDEEGEGDEALQEEQLAPMPITGAAQAAAEALMAGVERVLTPLRKAPFPPKAAEKDPVAATLAAAGALAWAQEADAAEAAAAATAKAAAAAAAGARRGRTPSRSRSGTVAGRGRSTSRGAVAAGDGAAGDQDNLDAPVPRSTGRAKRTAATPRAGRLNPLPEDAPAVHPVNLDAAGLLSDEEPAPTPRRGRGTSAAAYAAAESRRTSASSAAAGTPGVATRRSTRSTKSPAV